MKQYHSSLQSKSKRLKKFKRTSICRTYVLFGPRFKWQIMSIECCDMASCPRWIKEHGMSSNWPSFTLDYFSLTLASFSNIEICVSPGICGFGLCQSKTTSSRYTKINCNWIDKRLTYIALWSTIGIVFNSNGLLMTWRSLHCEAILFSSLSSFGVSKCL